MSLRKDLPYLAVRLIGILSALWMIYAIISTHQQIRQHTDNTQSIHALQTHLLWTTSLPLALLALIFLLPYKKLSRPLAWLIAVLIAGLGAHLFIQFFGIYLFASRLPPGAIPAGTLIVMAILLTTLLSQLLGLLYYAKTRPRAPLST